MRKKSEKESRKKAETISTLVTPSSSVSSTVNIASCAPFSSLLCCVLCSSFGVFVFFCVVPNRLPKREEKKKGANQCDWPSLPLKTIFFVFLVHFSAFSSFFFGCSLLPSSQQKHKKVSLSSSPFSLSCFFVMVPVSLRP